MASKQPQVGQHFRNIGVPFRNAAWVLTEIFTSRDGIEHGRLISTYDTTERKTLAVSVIADRSRFLLEQASDGNAG